MTVVYRSDLGRPGNSNTILPQSKDARSLQPHHKPDYHYNTSEALAGNGVSSLSAIIHKDQKTNRRVHFTPEKANFFTKCSKQQRVCFALEKG